MALNLLDVVKSQFGTQIQSKLADFLGEDSAVIQKAFDVALPTVLGGIVNQVAAPNLATNFFNTVKQENFNGSLFNSLGLLLNSGSATQGILNGGDEIINAVFGNKTSGIADWIASFAGIKTGSASSLMSFAAPLVLNAIGKNVAEKNLGERDVLQILTGQTDFLKAAIPSGLKSLLNFSNLNLMTPSVLTALKQEKTAENRLHDDENEALGLGRWLPWLILLGIGAAAIYFFRTCNNQTPEAPEAVAIPEVVTVDSFKMVQPVADLVKKITLPEGDIIVETGSFLDQLNTEILDTTLHADKPLTFDHLYFATSSAVLSDSSKVQLDDLVKILKAYPKVEIKIEGHTDNQGGASSNKKLSQNRAASVKTYLQTHGIDAKRLNIEGLGAEKPKSDNTTEEGRAANRRIEAFVTKK